MTNRQRQQGFNNATALFVIIFQWFFEYKKIVNTNLATGSIKGNLKESFGKNECILSICVPVAMSAVGVTIVVVSIGALIGGALIGGAVVAVTAIACACQSRRHSSRSHRIYVITTILYQWIQSQKNSVNKNTHTLQTCTFTLNWEIVRGHSIRLILWTLLLDISVGINFILNLWFDAKC